MAIVKEIHEKICSMRIFENGKKQTTTGEENWAKHTYVEIHLWKGIYLITLGNSSTLSTVWSKKVLYKSPLSHLNKKQQTTKTL